MPLAPGNGNICGERERQVSVGAGPSTGDPRGEKAEGPRSTQKRPFQQSPKAQPVPAMEIW